MLVLFTDFGVDDSYVGQIHGVLAGCAPTVPVIDLFHGVPNFDIRAGAYLLPALAAEFPKGAVFCCVVDPGVGSSRKAVMMQAGDRWFVGPDNGLFVPVWRRAMVRVCHEIVWRPQRLSASFHGRDLFAPVAAELALGRMPEHRPCELSVPADVDWPDDLAQIIYLDHYGNAVTGLRAECCPESAQLVLNGLSIHHARTFSDSRPGQAFWHVNANQLIEVAVNRGSAGRMLKIRVGDMVTVLD